MRAGKPRARGGGERERQGICVGPRTARQGQTQGGLAVEARMRIQGLDTGYLLLGPDSREVRLPLLTVVAMAPPADQPENEGGWKHACVHLSALLPERIARARKREAT